MERKQYTSEFKQRAVELVLSSGKPVSEIARDLGINGNMLNRWCREQERHHSHSFPGSGKRIQGTEQEEEIRRLNRELAIVKEERDILKKAMAIFSQPPK